MWTALELCLPVTIMTFAIFTRSWSVTTPGWPQVLDTAIISIGCWGLSFAMFGRVSQNQATDLALRVAFALVSLVALFTPSDTLALWVAVLLLPAVLYCTMRHRGIAAPKGTLEPKPMPA